MITNEKINQIRMIWDNYIKSNEKVFDTKGNELINIDKLRIESIKQLRVMIDAFLENKSSVYEFKTNVDSYNKRNNLWGFTATKGQMFFNQLVKNSDNKIEKLTALLIKTITTPRNLKDALDKIEALEKHCVAIFSKATNKRKVANPGSVNYFLSYFWQIQNNKQWPILYTSLSKAFIEIGIWEEHSTQKKTYEYFYRLNDEIKTQLAEYTKREISNWDAEHAFWNFKGNPNKQTKKKKKEKTETDVNIKEQKISTNPTFNVTEYLIPKVSKLIELGNETTKSSAAKGSEYEKLVAEIFKQLDFEVEILGQGSGRNPDAILRLREENTAFLVDAKAYNNGYSLGVDDRAIREYINHYIPKLQKEGYKKIGFIIVSNSFKSNFDSFINEITWDTDIKRFILLSSEALLYLLAYKTKDKLLLSTMIESLIGFNNPVEAKNIIDEFDDV